MKQGGKMEKGACDRYYGECSSPSQQTAIMMKKSEERMLRGESLGGKKEWNVGRWHIVGIIFHSKNHFNIPPTMLRLTKGSPQTMK